MRGDRGLEKFLAGFFFGKFTLDLSGFHNLIV